jgi:hypothetical protein
MLAQVVTKMLERVLGPLWGCWHSHYSFPMTVRSGARRQGAAAINGTYVVCLDCGKELPYDWEEMKVISSPNQRRTAVAALAPKEAA